MAADALTPDALQAGRRTPEDLLARLQALEAGADAALAAVLQDARRALQAAEARYQHLLAHAPTLICELTADGVITMVNDVCRALIGYRPAELLGRRLHELLGDEDDEAGARFLAPEGATARERDLTLRSKHGAPVTLRARWAGRYAAAGRLQSALLIASDVDAQRRAEDALRASEQTRHAMFERAAVARAEVSADGRIQRVNPKLAALTGLPREALLQRNWIDLVHPDDRDACRAWFAGFAAADAIDVAQRRYLHADGHTIWAQVHANRLPAVDGVPARILITVLDVTEHRRAREALATEKERLAVTLYSIADGVITTDEDGRVALINNVAQQLTGVAPGSAIGRAIGEVFQVIDEGSGASRDDGVREVLASGMPRASRDIVTLMARDGSRRLVAHSVAPIRHADGRVIGAVLVFRDVTERQRLEDELRKAQNLESLGVLAGGIAHDFNNILTVIFGNIALSKLRAQTGEDVLEPLTQAELAFGRARDLTHQLLTFSQGGAPLLTSGSIAALIADNADFVFRNKPVRVTLAMPDDLWPVKFDAGQMARVFDNVFINAVEAMPDGGSVRIEARNVQLHKRRSVPLPPGRYVEIRIKDSGHGIARDQMHRIFDPYFTTKREGSGLGLATVYSIVKRHGGYVTANSRLGKGTTLLIHLPADAEPAPAPPPLPSSRAAGGGRVLLMDDEETVREVGAALLQRLGYAVVVARDGAEALQLYAQARDAGAPFAGVILDLTVKDGMGGTECMARLRALDADVCGLVSSGYSTDPVMAQYRDFGFAGVMAKPYRLEDLGDQLARLVGPPAAR